MADPKYNKPARSVRVVLCGDGIWRPADSTRAKKESRQRERQERARARMDEQAAKRGVVNLNIYDDTRAAFDAFVRPDESNDAAVRRMFGLPFRPDPSERCGVRYGCESARTVVGVRTDTHREVALMAGYGESFEDLMRDRLGLPRHDSTPDVDARKIGSLLQDAPERTIVAA